MTTASVADLGRRARVAAADLAVRTRAEKDAALHAMADALVANAAAIIERNGADVERARENGTAEAMIDRLRLDESRIEGMANGLRQVAGLPDPVGEVVRGSVSIKTACGELEVGIKSGTTALLDVHTQFGSVRNRIEACDAPTQHDETVEVRARTSYGDIVIHRS